MVAKTATKGRRCPYCGSRKLWKMGLVPMVGGKKARLKCTNCGHSFYEKKEKIKKEKAG